jgi:hypothetical protein
VVEMRVGLVALALLTAGALSACSGDDSPPAYARKTACRVPASAVEAVLGTDQFKVSSDNGQKLPLGPVSDQDPADFECAITSGNGSLRFNALQDSPDKIAAYQASIAGYPVRFDYQGGRAGLSVRDDGFTAGWVCKTVLASVDGPKGEGATEADRKTLLRELADVAGCGS